MSSRSVRTAATENGAVEGDDTENQNIVNELQRLEDDVQSARDGLDAEDGTLEDDLARWQQRILERPADSLRSLEIMLTSCGYDSLVVLNLSQNAIDDISPIACAAKTLRLLNLNANAIARLPGPSDGFWPKFQSLTLLFLAGNRLASWRTMEGLAQCPKLLWLTVNGNPIMSQVNAREFIINKMPLSFLALNDHVVTDVECIKHAGRSVRFGAQSVRLFVGDALAAPHDFHEDEGDAMRYIKHTEATLRKVHAANSPTLITQRVVRGHLSRRRQLPLFACIRRLVVRVQATVRGYLFRRAIRCEFVELVAQRGEQDLLVGPMDDALFMTGGAHRGLRKLVALVQQWRIRFRLKKQAIAVKKIRFWCQMVYQRYRYRSQQLLLDQQELFIYYTAPFEEELLEMALKSAHRDPVLMCLPPPERERLIRQRCVHSGVSVLRTPSQSHEVTVSTSPHSTASQTPLSTSHRIQHENAQLVALKKTITPPLVRIFRGDQRLETHVLVTEKRLLQQDLSRLQQLQQYDQPTTGIKARPMQRAVFVHVNQQRYELEKRLVIVNRKILTACIKQQQLLNKPRVSHSLTHTRIRVRGHAPTRPERRKINRLLSSAMSIRAQGARAAMMIGHSSHHLTEYTKMRVFVPWSIDMYLQIMASLDRALLLGNMSASFALSYEQTRQIHAAVAIQSAWRVSRHQCKRNSLEVTILRAVRCLQRWWRYCMGLRRRMAFMRACLLAAGAINSAMLFMEASVYHILSNPTSWSSVRAAMRPCKEHMLHCLVVDGVVEISLSPAQMLLYASSSSSSSSSLLSSGDSSQHAGKAEAASANRCGAYLPVWMGPVGAPEHFEESMVSRDSDATAHLLVDHVHAEPTLIERELLLLGSGRSGSATRSSDADNPYQRFALCRQVVSVGVQVLEVARKFSVEHRKTVPHMTDTASAMSFVRLTFDSVDEARRRALVLVAKTFDPITHSFARLYSIEALAGATMLRHQWAVEQALGNLNDGAKLLRDCKAWLQAELPSKWLQTMEARLPQDVFSTRSVDEYTPVMAHQRAPPAPQHPRKSELIPHRPAPPPVVTVATSRVDGPAAIRLAESFIESGVQPVAPLTRPSGSSPSSGAFSRHQLLADRLGRPTYQTLDDKRKRQADELDYRVRDLREERERAAEAQIVDNRMLQREKAAELAGIHLEMHVKLQKIKYEQEIAKLQTRELVEREKMNEHTRTLTRRLETSFVAQTGTMMRNAARRAVDVKMLHKEATRNARAVTIKDREEEALARRQDAKSFCFVSNQRAKEAVEGVVEIGLAVRAAKQKKREVVVRQRIKEDKEIKQMLRLI